MFYQDSEISEQWPQPEQKLEDVATKRASKIVNGVKFCLTVIPGDKVEKTLAIETMTNMTDKSLSVPLPSGDKNGIKVRNKDGELLKFQGIITEYFEGLPRVSLYEYPSLRNTSLLNLHRRPPLSNSHSETCCFELEDDFPDLWEPGQYTIEFNRKNLKKERPNH